MVDRIEFEEYPGYTADRDGNIYGKSGIKLMARRHTGRAQVQIEPYGPKDVHRLIAEIFVPNPHSLSIVHHIDFNPLNNRAENLKWVSAEEHKIIHKR